MKFNINNIGTIIHQLWSSDNKEIETVIVYLYQTRNKLVHKYQSYDLKNLPLIPLK